MTEFNKRKYEDIDDYDQQLYEKINNIMLETIITKKYSSQEEKEEVYLKNEFFCLVSELEDKLDEYLDYDKILNQFIESLIDNTPENKKVKYDHDDYDKKKYKKINDIMLETKIIKKYPNKEEEENEYLKIQLFCIISELEDKLKEELNYDLIFNQFKQSLLNNTLGIKNRCTECNVDMGISNPRQLCGKTYCTELYD
jgi:hypothetical protein